VIDRQKLIGWILVIWSVGYIVYMLKARLLIAGPPLERKEWIYFWMSFGGIILGTINVRMAAQRERRNSK
jgi:hypothetical protein